MRSLFAACFLAITVPASAAPPEVLKIGSRCELFVDYYLIERLDGPRLEIGRPQPGGVAVTYDKPWEGGVSFYTTVPSEQLYTSQVQPYFRAPHIYISLPGRLLERKRT